MDLFSHYLILIGATLSIILALGQLVVKKRSAQNYIFAALLICTGIAMSKAILDDYVNIYSLYNFYSIVLIIDIVALSAIGPLYYLFIYFKINSKPTTNKIVYSPFIITLVALIFMVTLYIVNDFSLTNKMVRNYIFICVIYIFCYEIFTLCVICKEIFISKAKEKSVLIFALITTILAILQAVIWYLFSWQLSFILVTIVFIGLYITGHRHPAYLQITTATKKEKKKKYQKSQLENIDVDSIIQKLLKLMTELKLFTDESISLQKIAERLEITTHQLSELLNSHLKKSFITFLNEYRVEEAKRILINEPESSIVSICYQVGFNSYSAYANAFKNITGMTPKKYRNQNNNGKETTD